MQLLFLLISLGILSIATSDNVPIIDVNLKSKRCMGCILVLNLIQDKFPVNNILQTCEAMTFIRYECILLTMLYSNREEIFEHQHLADVCSSLSLCSRIAVPKIINEPIDNNTNSPIINKEKDINHDIITSGDNKQSISFNINVSPDAIANDPQPLTQSLNTSPPPLQSIDTNKYDEQTLLITIGGVVVGSILGCILWPCVKRKMEAHRAKNILQIVN